MSIIKTIPPDSRFIQTLNIFTATFNNPTLGKYDFDPSQVTGNNEQLLLNMTRASVYMISNYSISATMAEATFLEAIEETPLVYLYVKKNKHQIYKKPLPMANYIDGTGAIAYFSSPQDKDTAVVSFDGILNQVAALVGVPTVKVQFTCNIFEIVNADWINQYNVKIRDHSFEV